MSHFIHVKDPDDLLDYKFDFAPVSNLRTGAVEDFLLTGETIISHTLTADSGIDVESSTITDSNTTILFWAGGGVTGVNYRIDCQIETTRARIVNRSFYIRVIRQ